MDKPHSVEDYILSALISWLQLNKGVEGQSWVYSNKYVGDVPKGYTASVRIELRKQGELQEEEELE